MIESCSAKELFLVYLFIYSILQKHVRLWFPLSSKNADTSFSLHSELRYAFLFSLSTLGWSCASLASSQWKSTFFTKLWERRDAACWELKSWSKPWTHIETATSIPKNSQTQVRWGICSQTIMPLEADTHRQAWTFKRSQDPSILSTYSHSLQRYTVGHDRQHFNSV